MFGQQSLDDGKGNSDSEIAEEPLSRLYESLDEEDVKEASEDCESVPENY